MEAPQAEVTMPTCRLQREGESVAFVVDGEPAQSLPAATYDTLQKKLAIQGQVNAFEMEMEGGRKLEVLLVPLKELEAGPVNLRSENGVRYGRRYTISQSVAGKGGAPWFVIADADTGVEVERLPREEFAERARTRRMRSDTAYADMLGRFNKRIYFAVMGEIYTGPASPAAAAPPTKPATAEAPATPASPDEPEGTDEAEPAELPPWRRALAEHPRAAWIGAGASLLVLLCSVIYYVHRLPSGEKINVQWSNARSVDARLDGQLTKARFLMAADFRQYATAHPEAARQALRELRDTAAQAEKARLSNAQQAKLQELRAALQQLDQATPW